MEVPDGFSFADIRQGTLLESARETTYPRCFKSSDSDIKRSERNGLDVGFRLLKKSKQTLSTLGFSPPCTPPLFSCIAIEY